MQLYKSGSLLNSAHNWIFDTSLQHNAQSLTQKFASAGFVGYIVRQVALFGKENPQVPSVDPQVPSVSMSTGKKW